MKEPQHSWERDSQMRKRLRWRWSLAGEKAEGRKHWDATLLEVPLEGKLASLNHRELLHAQSTHSWGGISDPSLKPRLAHLATC